MSVCDGYIADLIELSKQERRPGDYKEDGLWHCGNCGEPLQKRIALLGVETIVGVKCKCREAEFQKKQAEIKANDERLRIESLRAAGVADRSMRDARFENAIETKFLSCCYKYVEKWKEMYATNSGLLFCGAPGTGKTFAAACIANALIDNGVPVLMTSFPRILNSGYDRTELADQIRRYPLLIIDDLGAERDSQYALETVYMIIDERYKSGKPMIVTTNLTYTEIKECPDIQRRRIYERIMEKCVPMNFRGENFRPAKAQRKRELVREIFREVIEEDRK